MKADGELLTAVRESFAGTRLNVPLDATIRLQGKILGNSFMPEIQNEIAIVIHANEIPKGIGLNLTVQSGGNGWGWSLGLVRASPECTGS